MLGRKQEYKELCKRSLEVPFIQSEVSKVYQGAGVDNKTETLEVK